MTAAVPLRLPRAVRLPGFDAVVVGLVVLIAAVAVVGPLVAPASAFRSDILHALQPPSAAHWFGTDDQGRDVAWRVVAGSRDTLLSAVLVVACYATIGTAVALLAAVGGRWVDEILMRLTDVVLAVPGMVVALGFAAALGPSLRSAVIAMVIAGWPMTARLLRGIVRTTSTSAFVDGARLLGVSRTRLMLRHVLPNSLDVLIVKWAGDIGVTVLVLAGLSFIGVGAQPPAAEWGAMVAAGKGSIATAWWCALFPGLAIALTATVFGLFGDAVQVRRQRGNR